MTEKTDRRQFIRLCGRTAAAMAVARAAGHRVIAPAFALENPPRVRLVRTDGSPLKAKDLPLHANWIFHYPYHSSPALLIKLDDPAPPTEVEDKDGKAYTWPGGVGPDKNIVAYAAICAHALSYDSKETAFLNYRRERNQMTGHGRVITCCAHASVYDPAAGAKVLAGPAKFPLAAVLLEHRAETDELFAVGLIGSELYGEFFKAYRKELRKAFGRSRYKKMVKGDVVAMPVKDYSEDAIKC